MRLVLLTTIVNAAVLDTGAVKPYINNSLKDGVNTECKNCPYSLCPNIAAYESEDPVNLTCWTHGGLISRSGNDGNK
jgi:hypothetical protein